MNKLSICFAGLSRQEEAEIVSLFKQANSQRGNRWLVTPETEADVLVIDMDSMYGQMSLMKALGTGKTLVALTAGGRADTDHVLNRPVTAPAIGNLMAAIESGETTNTNLPSPGPDSEGHAAEAAAIPAAAPAPIAAARALEPASAPAPAPSPTPVAAPPPVSGAAATPAPAPPMAMPETGGRVTAEMPAVVGKRFLADFLRPGTLPGPVRLQREGAPDLVLDPASQTYLGASALKPLVPLCQVPLTDSDFVGVAAAELPALEQKLGGRHPFQRLLWLAALANGGGALMPGYGPNEKYKLLKWPQTEREFPKHFRIATVMMKGPATLTEIAELSGVGLDEVIDYVNASLAVGVAEQDAAAPVAADAAKGGLLGRFRR